MMFFRAWLAGFLSLVLVVGSVPASAAEVDLLPELVPSRQALKDHVVVREGNRTLLKFTGRIGNFGRGALHVVGVRDSGPDLAAHQRITRSDGGYREEPIGFIKYHQAHRHFHLTGVARYRLLDSHGNVVTESAKVSFCLFDNAVADSTIPGFTPFPKYRPCSPVASASKTEMGISVGWADVYDKDLPGQSLDVTDLMKKPKQVYRLQMTANPDGMIHEVNQHHPRSVSVSVTLGGDSG